MPEIDLQKIDQATKNKYQIADNSFSFNPKRNNFGQFVKGNIPFDRTGILHTEESKNKMKLKRVGRVPNKPKEMLGKKFNRLLVIKQSGKVGSQFSWLCKCDCGKEKTVPGWSLRKGISKSCGCLLKENLIKRNKEHSGIKSFSFGKKGFFAGKKRPEHSKRMNGNTNPNWKGGITPENRKLRNSDEAKLWRLGVFERDKFTCQKTKKVGGKLVVHHINNFADFPELRFAIDNGITFSEKAHREFHHKYGKRNNNREQLIEFLCQI